MSAPRGPGEPRQRLPDGVDVDLGARAQPVADIRVDRLGPAPPVARPAGQQRVLRRHVTAPGARHDVVERQVAPPELAAAPDAPRTVAFDELLDIHPTARISVPRLVEPP